MTKYLGTCCSFLVFSLPSQGYNRGKKRTMPFLISLVFALYVCTRPSPHNNDHKVIIFTPFIREIAGHPSQQIEAECTRGESIKHPALLCLPILQTNHSRRFFLFQIAHKIPERTALNLCSICYWHLATAGGQGEEDCMACGATDSLADIVEFGLVKTQPLGDFQVRFVLLVPHQLLNHLHLSLCEKQLGGEERVLKDETSLPGFLNPLGKVSDGLRTSQTIAPHPIFRAIRRPGIHLSHPAGRSIKVLPRPLSPIIVTSSSSKTTSTSMMRSMVIVAVEAATSTMSVLASSTSSHSSSEAPVPEVASTPATSAGDLRVVVTTLVSSLGHHLTNISKVHPDPVPTISKLEPSHLIDRGCGGVNALILDSG